MQKDTSTGTDKNLNNVIKINEDQFKDHLGKMVRSTVEKTFNDMLDTEADQLCNASCRICLDTVQAGIFFLINSAEDNGQRHFKYMLDILKSPCYYRIC